jgi:hypothetical protein
LRNLEIRKILRLAEFTASGKALWLLLSHGALTAESSGQEAIAIYTRLPKFTVPGFLPPLSTFPLLLPLACGSRLVNVPSYSG